jgi:SAM-dependent methyltransferase
MFTLMVDLHREGARQGPGSEAETRRALDLTRLDKEAKLQVADIGCGTGAATLVLASECPAARITAVDLSPEFLDILAERARTTGGAEQVQTLEASMDALPFSAECLDLIWSEGAIYNMGFSAGIEAWKSFLRPGGVIAVSEMTWLCPDPPEKIRAYWNAAYPEIATAPEKVSILQRAGYDLLGYFILPPTSWADTYYESIEERIPAFLERHADQPEAAAIAEMARQEADLYKRYHEWFSYGFYVARKR